MSKSNNRPMGLLYNGLICLASGVTIVNVTDLWSIGVCFNCVGVGAITYYAWTWSKFDRLFRNLGLGVGDNCFPILKSKKSDEHCTTYKFTLPTGLDTDEINKKKVAIEQHFGKKMEVKHINRGLFVIEEYKNNNVAQRYFKYKPVELKGNIPILLGQDTKANPISFDLASGRDPHMLIGGNSGGGKSTAIRSMITNIILTKDNVELSLVDLKHGAEFTLFRDIPCVKDFAINMDQAKIVLKLFAKEIDRRDTLFGERNVNDIILYNKRHKHDILPYKLLVVDEMVDFKHDKDAMDLLAYICSKGRAAGMVVILCTQRPDKDVVDGLVKNNIANTLGLKTRDSTNSRIIIDEGGLEKLRGSGHGLFIHAGESTEIQMPDLSYEEAEKLLKPKVLNRLSDNVNHKPFNKFEQPSKSKVTNVSIENDEVIIDLNDVEDLPW